MLVSALDVLFVKIGIALLLTHRQLKIQSEFSSKICARQNFSLLGRIVGNCVLLSLKAIGASRFERRRTEFDLKFLFHPIE